MVTPIEWRLMTLCYYGGPRLLKEPGSPRGSGLPGSSGRRPAHPDARPGGRLADLHLVGETLDDRNAEPGRQPSTVAILAAQAGNTSAIPGGSGATRPARARRARIGHLNLEPAGQVRQREPDRFGGTVELMALHGARARLPDGEPDLVQERLVDAAAPGHCRSHEPGRPHVRGQRGEAQLDCCHLSVTRSQFTRSGSPGQGHPISAWALLLSPAGRDGLVDGVV